MSVVKHAKNLDDLPYAYWASRRCDRDLHNTCWVSPKVREQCATNGVLERCEDDWHWSQVLGRDAVDLPQARRIRELPYALLRAIKSRNRDQIELVLAQGVPVRQEHFEQVGITGNVQTLERLIQAYAPVKGSGRTLRHQLYACLRFAILRSNMEVMTYLLERDVKPDDLLLIAAARGGHTGVFKFMSLHNLPMSNFELRESLTAAAQEGQLDAVKLILDLPQWPARELRIAKMLAKLSTPDEYGHVAAVLSS